MNSCLFCRIAKGEIPAKKVYEDKDILAFEDINPQAPVHILVIPKKHIATVNDLEEADEKIIGKMYVVIKKLAAEKLAGSGYRIVCNTLEEAGQTVFHIHLHLLGGRKMTWPPG